MKRIALQMLLAGASTLAATTAFAQDAPAPTAGEAPPAAAPSNGGLGDIVVTAQRRAQNLLTVPLSISATTGAQLQNEGIKEITSLQFTTPGFLPQNGVGYVQVYIRGIGNSQYVGTGPSVTTYIDDVPRIFASQVNTFADVERVEVLKGAQGGLWGYNSSGGVINITTRQPSNKATAEATVSYGMKHTFEAKAYVNVPLTDQLAWNFSVTRESHGPYIKNVTRNRSPYTAAMFPVDGSPGTDGGINHNPYGSPTQTAAFFNSAVNPPKGLGNQNFWAGDTKLRFQATDNFKITLEGDYAKKHDSEGDQWVMISPPSIIQNLLQNIFFPYIAGIYQPCGTTPPYSNFRCSATNLPANFIKSGKGKWTLASSVPAYAWLVDYGTSGKMEWQLPGFTLTSITAYRGQHTLYDNDSGTDNVPIVVPIVRNHKWYFYQELRVTSTGDGPFHFIAGGNYIRQHVHYNTVIAYLGLLNSPVTDSNHDNHNWSVYAQVDYDLTDRLKLTTAGRYVHLEDKAVFDSPDNSQAKLVSKKFLPSATLSYRTNGGTIYARYAKGFKEGGINPVVPPSTFVDPVTHQVSPGFVFGPESVDTYEIGAKGKLLDNKLHYTTAVFYNHYTNLEFDTTGDAAHQGIIEAIVNAKSARTWGVEGSVDWRPIPPLTLGVNAGYLNAKYTNFNFDGTNIGLNSVNYSGQHMLYAPKLQVGITADLDQPISDKLRLVGSALISHISSTIQSNNPDQPRVIQPGYWLTNLRLGVKTADDHVGVFLYVNNLFDQYYTTFGSSGGTGASQVEGDPRIIGGEVQIKF